MRPPLWWTVARTGCNKTNFLDGIIKGKGVVLFYILFLSNTFYVFGVYILHGNFFFLLGSVFKKFLESI